MTASSGTSVEITAAAAAAGPRPLSVPDVDKLPLLHEPRIDSYRFSMANLEGKQTHKGQMLHIQIHSRSFPSSSSSSSSSSASFCYCYYLNTRI